MKKDNLKITAKSVKKIKPLAKGAVLKSANAARRVLRNTESAENISLTTPSPSLLRRGAGRWFRNFNFKRWHKLSAAFVSIAIIGIVVFFQFAPENARSKTFPPKADQPWADTFFQTAWSSIAGTVIYSL